MVDAACSSSLYAIGPGVTSLLAGACDIAYCGGVSGVTPRYNVTFSELHGLSPSGDVRAFDDDADGTLFSDGAGVVALKRLDQAVEDGDPVFGVLVGFGGSSDGRETAIYAPNPVGQRRCPNRARQASLPAGEGHEGGAPGRHRPHPGRRPPERRAGCRRAHRTSPFPDPSGLVDEFSRRAAARPIHHADGAHQQG
ncbi:beta-ketoacyl synthase N-terminal-like domain-containing protein [Streptomyces tsukubensis]|uniref:beta-ketoacyl synthase N-terminal-like domain-containing protein n=1 Tax=Streptomyces tsukubensis TaxID=83656 RepID=UPI0036BD3840